jgi:hypothetical protein
MQIATEINVDTSKRLGKAPAKGSPMLLQLGTFLKAEPKLPEKTNFWTKKAAFPLRSFGNTQYGDCTRASQALLSMRMERLECKKTPVITDEEVVRVYTEMCHRLYGADDTGAYESDALSEWRKPELTFRDAKGRPLTIDAYTAINHRDVNEVKKALFLAGAHGIKVCFNLPNAFSDHTDVWDIPAGQQLTGPYVPGSWGGHSIAAVDYDTFGVRLVHSWGVPDGKISWAAFTAYADEAYMVIDSIDSWKKKKLDKYVDLKAIKAQVNAASTQKIK